MNGAPIRTEDNQIRQLDGLVRAMNEQLHAAADAAERRDQPARQQAFERLSRLADQMIGSVEPELDADGRQVLALLREHLTVGDIAERLHWNRDKAGQVVGSLQRLGYASAAPPWRMNGRIFDFAAAD